MGKNINIIKNLKTKNSFRFIEGSNVNQVAATTGNWLEIPKGRFILPEKHQVR